MASTFINAFIESSFSLNISFITKYINTIDITLNNEDIGFTINVILLLIKVKNPKHAEITSGIFATATAVIDFVNGCLFSLFNKCIIIAITSTFNIGDITDFIVPSRLNV